MAFDSFVFFSYNYLSPVDFDTFFQDPHLFEPQLLHFGDLPTPSNFLITTDIELKYYTEIILHNLFLTIKEVISNMVIRHL